MKKSINIKTIHLISIVPNLVGGEGHTIPYHQAVNKAVELLEWNHQVFVPQTAIDYSFLSHWLPCLYPHDLEAESSFFQKVINIYHAFRLGISLQRNVKENSLEDSQLTILFLERFIHLQLFALCIAVWLLPSKNLCVWLLYRQDTHNSKTFVIYKLLNHLIKLKLPKSHFKLLTDSELLKQSLSVKFEENLKVMPIPHTDFKVNSQPIKSNSQDIIWCWWPGSPRLEKGWKTIQSLSEISFKQGNKIGLLASNNANLIPHSQGIQVKLLSSHLSREEYDHWLAFCDIILLPYDAIAYQERTSGIFTEAIIAGKIPLVTPNTWMAYELEKYGLQDDLVLSWEDPETVLNRVLEIVNNPHIEEKRQTMQAAYQAFHNVKQYAQGFQELLPNSVSF